jgi:hypothetical protein
MKRALILLAFVAASAAAETYQTMGDVARASTSRLVWLESISTWSNEDRVRNLALYYGEEFTLGGSPNQDGTIDVYLIRRDSRSGHITFLQVVGRLPAES